MVCFVQLPADAQEQETKSKRPKQKATKYVVTVFTVSWSQSNLHEPLYAW